jgi:hypothetical protein
VIQEPQCPVCGTVTVEAGGRSLTDIAPRSRTISGQFRRGRPVGRFHAVIRADRELLIFGRIDGKDFYREFRSGDPAVYAPGIGPGKLVAVEPSRVVILDGTSYEKRRIDLYQFIRLNWHRCRHQAEGPS